MVDTDTNETPELQTAAAPEVESLAEAAAAPEVASPAEAQAAPEVASPAEAAAAPEVASPAEAEVARAGAAVDFDDVADGPVLLPEIEDDAAFDRRIAAELEEEPLREGDIYSALVTALDDDGVTVALFDELNGVIDRDEFVGPDGSLSVAVGDSVDVYLDRIGNDTVEVSREKAEKLRLYQRLVDMAADDAIVTGTITGKVKGGLSVDIGIRAFLPGSQVDMRPTRNIEKFIGQTLDFKFIKFDKRRGNVVLSRRAIQEHERAGRKDETLANLTVGATVIGMVKNLTDYGCFVDIGGVDGLLHVTDMSWGRVGHPKSVVQSGDEITVQVLRFDPKTEKISLGLKQLTPDPWQTLDRRYQVGQRVEGRVVSVAEFGAFLELDAGIEGLVHVSEMSWTERVKHAKEIVHKGQEVEAVILKIDHAERRIALGMKQTQANPWVLFRDQHPPGTEVEGPIMSVTHFGLFVKAQEGIEGLVHVSDLSWTEKVNDPADLYEKGQVVKAVVLNVDVQAERLALGIKQLGTDPWDDVERRFPIGHLIEGTVKKVLDFGAFVSLDDHIDGLVHVSEISEDHIESVASVLEEGQTVSAMVISVNASERKIGLSIKRFAEADAVGELADFGQAEATRPTTIGDLIKEKIDISSLPEGPSDDSE